MRGARGEAVNGVFRCTEWKLGETEIKEHKKRDVAGTPWLEKLKADGKFQIKRDSLGGRNPAWGDEKEGRSNRRCRWRRGSQRRSGVGISQFFGGIERGWVKNMLESTEVLMKV